MALHVIKLCVGCDTVEELLEWRATQEGPWILKTRQTPKRAAEIEDGGSLYRVYKGVILSRQRILQVNTVGEGPAARCHMTLDVNVVRTIPQPRRAFQGWRYLDPKDAPVDLASASAADMPPELARQLREIGAW